MQTYVTNGESIRIHSKRSGEYGNKMILVILEPLRDVSNICKNITRSW